MWLRRKPSFLKGNPGKFTGVPFSPQSLSSVPTQSLRIHLTHNHQQHLYMRLSLQALGWGERAPPAYASRIHYFSFLFLPIVLTADTALRSLNYKKQTNKTPTAQEFRRQEVTFLCLKSFITVYKIWEFVFKKTIRVGTGSHWARQLSFPQTPLPSCNWVQGLRNEKQEFIKYQIYGSHRGHLPRYTRSHEPLYQSSFCKKKLEL